MEKQYTHITVILDRSGSMGSIQDDTIGGFNAFLEQQKTLAQEARLSLVQFDSQDPYEVVYQSVPLEQVPPLTHQTYKPRASTPLLDALGRGIRELETNLAELSAEQRPDQVMVVVVTDGMENASQHFSKSDIEVMIQAKTTLDNWQFIFLSADLGAIHEAQDLGFQRHATLMFQKSGRGSRDAWGVLSKKMLDVRSLKSTLFAFGVEDRMHPDDPFCAQAPDAGPTVMPLSVRNGHLFLEHEGALWLIDTGAPSSFGRSSRLTLAGETFRLAADYLGLTPDALSRAIGTPCAGLLGADVLGRFDHVFDLAAGTLTLSTGTLYHTGQTIPLTMFVGIPILEVRIAGADYRMFFDTGASVSYLQEPLLQHFPETGTVTDFYPGFGVFETETHRVEMQLGGRAVSLRCGTLPDLLGSTLLMAGTRGIVGLELLQEGAVGYFPRRRCLVF
jgi:hypothetical protein